MTDTIRRAIAKRSFCTLATSSEENRPLVTGVLYAAVGDELYISTLAGSAKARNIRANPRVGVCIPVRRFPVGPPFSVQFQGTAELLPADHEEIRRLLGEGRLKRITSHGELDAPDGCFVRVRYGPRVATYGVGVPLREVLRDPVHASRSVRIR